MRLDPISLLHTIREAQSALATINATDPENVPSSESLEHFLSRLPELWREGEVRPTHTSRDSRSTARTCRSRPDPFDGVWCEILGWIQKQPDITASALMDRSMRRYPDRYSRRQLRTLQCRARQWRRLVARQLVYASAEQSEAV